jgi:tRNA A-37 threonylcarbamoyl transferase component Bud32
LIVQGEVIEAAMQRWPEGAVAVKVRDYREIWRIEIPGLPSGAYLKWYPRGRWGGFVWAKRLLLGDPALREYNNLVRLQQLGIAAPRAIAFLSGLSLGGRKGDGVLSHALEPSEPLDQLLHRCKREAAPLPDRRKLFAEVLQIVGALSKSRLGHADLHFGNILIHRNRLHLIDAYAVHTGGLTPADLEVLGHAAQGHATRTELVRAWQKLATRSAPLPPLSSSTSRRQWRKAVERSTRDSDYVGQVKIGPWSGLHFRQHRFPLRYSRASGLVVESGDWEREFPRLLAEIEGETLRPLKRSGSGDVWSGEVVLAGVPLGVVVKRPFRSKVYRYVTEIGRGSRAWRGWRKSWMLIARGIPAAWPLLVLERRAAGVVIDQLLVCERVEGEQLDGVDLDALGGFGRDRLLRRVGRLLRRIDDTGIVHFDTKASNIMIRGDEVLGPSPVLVDVDGVRSYRWRGEGIRRLDRSMRDHHPHYTEADAASLRAGYAPFARSGAPSR